MFQDEFQTPKMNTLRNNILGKKIEKYPLNIKCAMFGSFFLFGLLLGSSYGCNGSKYVIVDGRARKSWAVVPSLNDILS